MSVQTFVIVLSTLVIGVSVGVLIGLIWGSFLRHSATGRDVVVLVLGDVGHSPRMGYHALSLADRFKRDPSERPRLVRLVAYKGSSPPPILSTHPNISIHLLSNPKRITAKNPLIFLVSAASRVFTQLLEIMWLLLVLLPRADALIIQNPPAIPTLAIAQFVRFVRGSRLIIDWHNFGFSIMAMNKSKTSPIIKFAKWYERIFGRYAEGHLCVTNAMSEFIQKEWAVRGDCVTLYDRAPRHFKKLELSEMHEFLSTLGVTSTGKLDYTTTSKPFPQNTLLTCQMTATSKPSFASKRPALLVSSTSWTPDEDFSLLLSALELYDSKSHAGHPSLVVVVTGKGPQKAFYEAKMAALKLKKVQILTAWLGIEDYPKLLGSADLGVCLHTSSSGLDLPMKVVDMFGCGLPVCAVAYPCLNELVQHGVNGLVFSNSNELSEQLLRLFDGFSRQDDEFELGQLRAGTAAFQQERWPENWEKNVGRRFF